MRFHIFYIGYSVYRVSSKSNRKLCEQHFKKSVKYVIRNIKQTQQSKGKAVPLQAWSGPEGSRKLRFPDFMTTGQDGGTVVSSTHWPPLPLTKCSWYSFLLEAESTPGPKYDRKDFRSLKNSTDTSWDLTSHLPICSTAP